MQNALNIDGSRRKKRPSKKIAKVTHGKKTRIKNPVADSQKLIAPAWPLQNTVAVNPFWFNRDRHLTDVFHEMAPILNRYLFMPLAYYQERFRDGEISTDALRQAIEHASKHWPDLSRDIGKYTSPSRSQQPPESLIKTAAEALPSPLQMDRKITEDLGKYCAAYFDDNQALVKYPWQSGSFWNGWLEAQKYDRAMPALGIKGFKPGVDGFREKSPRQAIQYIFDELGLSEPHAQFAYCQKLLVGVLGWASQFKYLEWQRSLGYSVARTSDLTELLAVRMIYDYLYYRDRLPAANAWVANLLDATSSSRETSLRFAQHYVWQLAAELTSQRRTAQSFRMASADSGSETKYQMVFCIDVRSEMLRRHIEETNPQIQTLGFAGFFGAPIDYQRANETYVGHRLPVLLNPAFKLIESDRDSRAGADKGINRTLVASYFRNLRKASIGSFLYVEVFGILALGNILARGLSSFVAKLRGVNSFSRFSTKAQNNPAICEDPNHRTALPERISRAKFILTHLGLTSGFARYVIFCGHGAQTTNNAMASALDCGACGGHAGDINARFVADLLNDPSVRDGLSQEGIQIPRDTRFIAAVHETVTDSVLLLEDQSSSENDECMKDMDALRASLGTASTATAFERHSARSEVLDPKPHRRAANWSEVRPEWGLAGNAHFVVAPRSRTKGINLSSRAFLHDYNWRQDEDFGTLELIMTAPMVVTNWINMQYYGSVVAPDHFGSGNKVLHNITGENGVIEGNGGDLRIGLAAQSVHDGSKFTHEPLRLSVYIEAPREAIEEIIEKHQVVRDLVENEWLHLLQIDPETLTTYRRRSGGQYETV